MLILVFFLKFLYAESLSVCFYGETKDLCPKNVENINISDSIKIKQLSIDSFSEVIFYFTTSMDTKKVTESVFNSIVFNSYSNVTLIGCNITCDIVIESLFTKWPEMNLTMKGLHVYTAKDTLHTKMLNITYSIIYPTGDNQITVSADELYLDALSSLHIYQWKSNSMSIKMDVLPIDRVVTLYISAINDYIDFYLNEINTNLDFSLKSHFIELEFPNQQSTMRFIPKFCHVKLNLGFSNSGANLSVSNYLISSSMSLVDYALRGLPSTNIIFKPTYWNLDIFPRFLVDTQNSLSITSYTSSLPITLTAYESNVSLATIGDTALSQTFLLKVNMSNQLLSKGNFEMNNLFSMNSNIDLKETDGSFILNTADLSDTTFSGSFLTLQEKILFNMKTTRIEYARITDRTSLIFDRRNDQNGSLIIDNLIYNNSEKVFVEVVDSVDNKDYHDLICVKDVFQTPYSSDTISQLCDHFNIYGEVGGVEKKFSSKCAINQDGYTCISLINETKTYINYSICLYESSDEEQICSKYQSNEKQHVSKFAIPNNFNSITLLVATTSLTTTIENIINLSSVSIGKTVYINGIQNNSVLHISLQNHEISILNATNVGLIFVDENVTIHSISFDKVAMIQSPKITATILIAQDSNFNFSIDYIQHIVLVNYDIDGIEITNSSIFINYDLIVVNNSTQNIDIIGDNMIRATIKIIGSFYKNFRWSNSNSNSLVTFYVSKYVHDTFDMDWSGSLVFPHANYIPISFSLQQSNWISLPDDEINFGTVYIQDSFRPIINSRNNFETMYISNKGRILEYEDGEIYVESLYLSDTEKKTGNLKVSNVYVDPKSYTNIKLDPKKPGEKINFHFYFSYSSVPYLEIEFPENQKGSIIIENIDTVNKQTLNEKIPVNFMCAPNLVCDNWDVSFEAGNSSTTFSSECNTGTFNPLLKCLSIVPVFPEQKEAIPSYMIAIYSILGVLGLCFLIAALLFIIAKVKRRIEASKLIMMQNHTLLSADDDQIDT